MDPRFLFRPDTFLTACWRKLKPRPARYLARAAWGDCFELDPRRSVAANIYMRGVHELPVCETLCRLAVPGGRAVDVGANIGVMTSVLSARVGPAGRVAAFEAHPDLFSQ